MSKLARERALLSITALSCAAALLDVFTGWTLLTPLVVSGCLIIAVTGLILGANRLRLPLLCLVIAIMGLHLGFSLFISYENDHWESLANGKAEHALSKVLSEFEVRFSEVYDQAERISRRLDLVGSVQSGNRSETFSVLTGLGSSERLRSRGQGVLVTEVSGRVVAWSGALPNLIQDPYQVAAGSRLDVTGSTTHSWIRAQAAISLDGAHVGWVYVFQRLEAIYPGILDETTSPTLAEEVAGRVGYQARILLGREPLGQQSTSPRDVSGEIRLPNGGVAGRAVITPRSFEDEANSLRSRGLFIASIVVLVLIALGSASLCARLAGPRFQRASNLNILLLLVVIGVVRLGFSLLRDFLNLGNFDPFASYYYATQIPSGILRSPADLMITSLFVGLGLSLLIVAKVRRGRSAPGPTSAPRLENLPFLVLGLVVGLLGAGIILLTDRIIMRVFADSAIIIYRLSPFGIAPSDIVMRAGLLALTVSLILLGAVFLGWQISLLRRYWSRGGTGRKPIIISGLIVYSLVGAFVIAGTNWVVLITATSCLACALVFDGAIRRRIGIGMISLALGFALAASVIQFPYALADYNAKRREFVEAASVQAVARTDAWKMSVLEEALAWVSRNSKVGDTLHSGQDNLDAFALNLWANSILGKAHVVSSVYILNATHAEIGRFSIQEIGDLPEIDAALREARFIGRPITSVMRGTSGGREVELYVGVAPFFRDGIYVGSVVVSIPYAYKDIESAAGFRATFFDAVAGTPSGLGLSGEEYSASLVSDGKIISTTGRGFEIGRRIGELDAIAADEPGWLEHRVAGMTHASYFAPYGVGPEGLLLSFPMPSLSDEAIRLMGITVGNLLLVFLVILIVAVIKAVRHLVKWARGMPRGRVRWGFVSKLAVAFVLIAIIPTLILGTASNRFLQARLREIMEARAAESLTLSRLALDRIVFGEAVRLARNPILIDALTEEPSLLGQLVTQDLKVFTYDISSAVIDSRGDTLATFGHPRIPAAVLGSVLEEGRSYNFFSADRDLIVKSAVPIRDEINPDRIIGCAFVSRRMDDDLARQISSDLGRDLSFFGHALVAASSRRELFISELMPSMVSPGAFVECFIGGRELHFTWERLGKIDAVIGYAPLRGYDGAAVGAISVPVVFRKDDVGRRMEATSGAISYLLVIVICAIFIFGLMLARRISQPIRELIQGTLRIGSGDLSFTIPRYRDDEIGDLVTSFNKMTVALARSRKTLSERKRYIETIIGNVGAGIISTDPRGRIDTFNSAAEKMLGIKARHARGRDVTRLLRRVGASSLAAVLAEVHGGKEIARREVSLSQKDGRSATLRAVATVVKGPRARDMGKVIVFEDVTELIRSKKLIAWSEMARQVAHEIKNPLTPMKLSAQHVLQARRDGAEDFDRVLEDSVATIVEQIESLRRIAIEFSQFSRMPERKLTKTDLNEILEESLAQYERTIAGSVEIRKSLGRNVPHLLIDRDELKRVFLNIIENAVQAMPQGGTLEVRSMRGRPPRKRPDYEVAVSSRGDYGERMRDFVEVSFTDTGVGISQENAGKLFEPNFSTKSHGTGLGLAICRGILDAYGAEMLIESTQGVGTCVRVRIPLTDRPRTPRRPHRRPRRTPRSPRNP